MEQILQNTLPQGTLLQGGKYRIECTLGSGGFGNTYLATNLILDVTIAIKEFFMRDINLRQGNEVTVSMPSKLTTFEEQKNKFLKEAKRMAKLHSEHIVRVMDVFMENSTCYYVMDYIEGLSLRDHVQKYGPMNESEAMKIVKQILSALETIHSQQPVLLHLDIKPANIIVTKQKEVFLIDFGASKCYSEGDGVTTWSSVAYSENYAPLELIEGNFQHIGPWTDYYELGSTLYFLLTGKQPPKAIDIIYNNAINFPANVSQDARQFISALMQIQYKQRPQNVSEIRRMIDAGNVTQTQEETTLDGQETKLQGTETKLHESGRETKMHEPEKETKQQDSKQKLKWSDYEMRNPITNLVLCLMPIVAFIWFLYIMVKSRHTVLDGNPLTIASYYLIGGSIFIGSLFTLHWRSYGYRILAGGTLIGLFVFVMSIPYSRIQAFMISFEILGYVQLVPILYFFVLLFRKNGWSTWSLLQPTKKDKSTSVTLFFIFVALLLIKLNLTFVR